MPVTINGSAGVTTNSGAVYNGLQTGTSITLTNQTAPEFTSIPSWVRRITLMFNGVSTNSTGGISLQLGDAGGYEITGYVGSSGTQANSTSFTLNGGSSLAATTYSGIVTVANVSGNVWSEFGVLGRGDGVATIASGGAKTLSETLTSVRLFIDGTQFFDAGTINILFE
jgi:hypothetical protein